MACEGGCLGRSGRAEPERSAEPPPNPPPQSPRLLIHTTNAPEQVPEPIPSIIHPARIAWEQIFNQTHPNQSNTPPTMRTTQAAAFRQPPPGRGNVPASRDPIPPKNHDARQHLAARSSFAERSRPLPPALKRPFTSSATRPFLHSGSGPRPNPPHPPQPA